MYWTPYFGDENLLPATKRFYAPRFDRGFESSPLDLEDVLYNKGLAIYCRTETGLSVAGAICPFPGDRRN